MDKIINMAGEMSDRIAKSQTYKEYIRTRNIIFADPAMKKAVEDFKIRHFNYQKNLKERGHSFEEEKYIAQECHKLTLNEDIYIYFESEKKLIKLLSDVFNRVAEGCQLDIFV